MNKVETIVTALAEPVVAQEGCSLWAVEYAKEGGRWVLRVLIDRDGGVGTEHCEAVSRAIDPLLDEADPIEGTYTLEVSSAGLERPLKRPADFERCLGRTVLVRLYVPRAGVREYVGLLAGYDGRTLTLSSGETFDKSEMALVRLYVEW